jgi:hypothetical protein
MTAGRLGLPLFPRPSLETPSWSAFFGCGPYKKVLRKVMVATSLWG